MPKRIYTIEIDEAIDNEEISEIIVISNKGISHKANLLPNINSGIDGSSYEISLSHYVKNMKELENLWNINFYHQFKEYIDHFPFITIDLSHNHLTDEYLINILKVLQDERMDLLRQKLVKINIEQNRISKSGFQKLFEFINNCPNFKELEASINLLGQRSYYELKEAGDIPKCIRDTFFYSSH